MPEEISGAVGGQRDEDDDAHSYSMSFDESVTDEESFRQVLPSESHRKEVKQQEMHNASLSHDGRIVWFFLCDFYLFINFQFLLT